jgi:predicted outer membrane repeat protein
VKDAAGNVSAVYSSLSSVEVNTTVPSDTTSPSVDTFTAASTSNSLDISITTFSASDDTAVTGYLITESNAQPASGDSGWSGSAPTTYIVASDGSYTLYPWAKDAAGNVSAEFGSPASVDVDTPLTVTNTNDSGPGSLRSILTSATSGDTVIFDSAISGQTIYLASTLTISNNLTIDGSALDPQITISGDSDNDGTGDVQVFSFSSGATVTLNSLTITKGSNSTAAGIFNASGATLTITNSTLTDNATTGGPGGGIRNDGTLTVTTSTFSYNSAFGGSGGGIRNIGTLTVANSTFSNNTTTGSGGGIYNVSGFVSLTITNSTFSGNSAASQGGGIYYSGGVLNYANTMIANSVSGGDCAGDGTINTNTNNLVEDGSCSAALNGDPNLGPLADNGGSTQTIALLPGSTAIDAGDDSVCATAPVNSTSQNGVTRPVGAHCDIGSFEYVDTIAPTVTSIVRAGGSTTSATSVSFLVTFSEDVTGVDSIANDFSLTTTGSVSGAAVTGLSGSGSIYTITVSTGTGTGTIRLDVPISASITDSAANSLDGLPFISGPAYSILKPPAPKAPVLRSPRNNIVTNNRMPTLWWTSVKGGVTYEVEVATDNSFAIIMDTDVVSGLSRTVAVPLGDDEYFWRVRASNASNQPGAWSSIRTFTIDTTGPIAPTLISPTDNASSNRTPSFKWLSVPTAVLYELQYDNDSDFSSPYDVTTRGTFRKPPAMKPGTYYWRVRAKDASGNWGNWSAPFIITITNP